MHLWEGISVQRENRKTKILAEHESPKKFLRNFEIAGSEKYLDLNNSQFHHLTGFLICEVAWRSICGQWDRTLMSVHSVVWCVLSEEFVGVQNEPHWSGLSFWISWYIWNLKAYCRVYDGNSSVLGHNGLLTQLFEIIFQNFKGVIRKS